MASGTVTCGQLVINEDSLVLDQLTNVNSASPNHDDVLIYKDNTQDPLFVTGWHSQGLLIENFTNVNSSTIPTHNEILVYNDFTIDSAFPTGWVNKDISSVFTGLNSTISSIVDATNAIVDGQKGKAAKGDMIMFDDTVSGSGTVNVSVGSAFDNNAIFKRELTDEQFSFVQNLNKGEIMNETYPTSTLLRSSKGMYGFSGPSPTPLGVPSLSFKLTKFSTSVIGTTAIITSLGLEVTVTLLESDGVTISAGPTVIPSNQTQSFACNGTGEFTVSSSGNVVGYVNENGTNKRLLVPMVTDLIVYNRNHTVSCLTGTANVTLYRRNDTTSTTVVTSGTPTSLSGGGSQADYALGGWLRLVSDVPICAYSYETNGAAPGMPVDQLSQVFSIPSVIDETADYSTTGIFVSSIYNGTATVYDNTGTEIASFNYTRVGTNQLTPAGNRWRPSLVGTTPLNGGYIITNTPAYCIVRFNGSTIWTGQSATDMMLVGTTPDNVRAEIRLDASGVARRRDLSDTGVVTWTSV